MRTENENGDWEAQAKQGRDPEVFVRAGCCRLTLELVMRYLSEKSSESSSV